MDERIITGLIVAGSSFMGVVLKDLIAPYYQDLKKRRHDDRNTLELYARPLAASAEPLFFRLREILLDKRSEFLLHPPAGTSFSTYKFISTIYRLAALIAWIRAMKLEQSYLLHSPKPFSEKINKAIHAFEGALADGPHVEIYIAKTICNLWSLDLPNDPRREKHIAAKCEAAIHELLSSHNLDDINDIRNLNSDAKVHASRKIANIITDSIGRGPLSDSVVNETKERVVEILSVKMAWIYRDWQRAIGDLMICETNGKTRRFDVIGYAKFEDLYDEGNKWVTRLTKVFRGVNFDSNDPTDFRVDQIRSIAKANAELLLSLQQVNVRANILQPSLAETVRQFLNDLENNRL